MGSLMDSAGFPIKVGVVCAGLLTATIVPAFPASMQIVPSSQIEATIIAIQGELMRGDNARFEIMTDGIDSAIIFLSGPGGNSDVGIALGRTIRERGYLTAVNKGAQCFSSCAFAWLGGVARFMGEQAEIGFHGVYEMIDGAPVASRTGNALLGAYLADMGLGWEAVEFISGAPPGQFQHLTPEDARRVGIDFEVIILR